MVPPTYAALKPRTIVTSPDTAVRSSRTTEMFAVLTVSDMGTTQVTSHAVTEVGVKHSLEIVSCMQHTCTRPGISHLNQPPFEAARVVGMASEALTGR